MQDGTNSLQTRRGRLVLLGVIGGVVVAALAYFLVIEPGQVSDRPTLLYFRLEA